MATIAADCSQHRAAVGRKPEPPTASVHYPFWFGGSAAAIAACITHPLDLLKVRLQTLLPDAPRHAGRLARQIIANEGVRALYAGLTAALLRQMTYSTVRFGVYEDLKARYRQPGADHAPSPLALVALASISGVIGGILGSPADLILVRMQSDGGKPVGIRKHYSNAIDGLAEAAREDGVAGLFRGVEPNAARAGLMTASQLASYDVFKSLVVTRLGGADNVLTHFVASLSAGLVATTVCSPVDVIKTRVMTDRSKGLTEVLRVAIREEGVFWAFRGWLPSFVRLGPQTMLTLVFLEQHRALHRCLVSHGERR